MKPKTLLVFEFETGDASCRYWPVLVIVYGPFNSSAIETSVQIYMDDHPECDYDEAAAAVLTAHHLMWEWIDGKIPECDLLDVIFV